MIYSVAKSVVGSDVACDYDSPPTLNPVNAVLDVTDADGACGECRAPDLGQGLVGSNKFDSTDANDYEYIYNTPPQKINGQEKRAQLPSSRSEPALKLLRLLNEISPVQMVSSGARTRQLFEQSVPDQTI